MFLDTPRSLLEARRRLGQDRWDEVWEGVLHMVPPPNEAHQELNDWLGVFFKTQWQALGAGRTRPETGVKRPGAPPQPELGADVPSDYRTPDRSFLLPDRYDRLQGGWIVGGPDAVLEIVSPGDESRDKLGFYLDVGVEEVILVDRATRQVEVLRAAEAGFEPVPPDGAGWVTSAVLGTQLRREVDDESGAVRLHLRRTDAPERELVIEP